MMSKAKWQVAVELQRPPVGSLRVSERPASNDLIHLVRTDDVRFH